MFRYKKLRGDVGESLMFVLLGCCCFVWLMAFTFEGKPIFIFEAAPYIPQSTTP